jgi:hypothetical protein
LWLVVVLLLLTAAVLGSPKTGEMVVVLVWLASGVHVHEQMLLGRTCSIQGMCANQPSVILVPAQTAVLKELCSPPSVGMFLRTTTCCNT